MTRPWLSALLVVVALAAACSTGESGWSDDDIVAAFSADTVDDREGVLASMGTPDTFAISWEDVGGKVTKVESWGYHVFATRVDFIDEEAALTTDLPIPDHNTIYPGWYHPEAFTALMPTTDALAVAGDASPAGHTPEKVDLSGGGEDTARLDLYAGDQIMLGFLDGQLVYVETVALATDVAP